MALLGSSVDPRLFMQDYSGFTSAAEIQAQGMQNLGRAVGGAIEQVGDYFKQQGEKKKLIKKSDVQIDAALKLFPDLAPILQGVQDQIRDENIPLDDRAAKAESVAGLIDLGVGEMRNASNLLMRQQKLGLERQYKAAQLGMRAEEIGIQKQRAAAEAGELKESEISIFDPEINDTRSEKVWINKQGQAFDYDTKKPIINKEKYFYGEEGGLGELPPTSQVGGSASDLIASAAQMNIGKLSTAKTPGTQGGNVGCADAICRTFKEATGEELVPGGTLSTREMATTLENDPRFVKVPLGQAQKGDIVLTPRKGNKAGHTGIVLDGGAIASNSSKGFAGKSPGTFVQNYTIDSWKKSVAPRNPSETAAYRYVGPQQIDNALAMGSDMTQQAMGNPEQQAMTAQQIEQGAGMATAQTNQGVPTEPSVATQQPQLPQPQRRMVRGIPTGRDKSGARFRIATPEEAARFGVPAGQIDETTGRFYPVSQPSGNTFTAEIDPKTGKVVFSQGPTKAQQAAEAEAKAEEKAKLTATGVTQDLYELKKRYTDLSAGTGPIPALSRLGASAVPGTPAAEVKEVADRVTAGLTIENIMSARRSNAAGAALGGSTSDKDMKILEKATTSLNAVQNPEAFNREWTRIMEAQLNIAYGTPEQRAKLVKENKITKEFNKEIEDLYPPKTINMKGELVPRREKSAPNIKSPINPEVQAILDKFSKGQ